MLKQLCLLILLITSQAYGQSTISGVVKDASDVTFPGANVYLKELENALDQFKAQHTENSSEFNMTMIEQAMNMMTKKFKERFVVKIGEHIHTINVAETAYFFSQDKATFL